MSTRQDTFKLEADTSPGTRLWPLGTILHTSDGTPWTLTQIRKVRTCAICYRPIQPPRAAWLSPTQAICQTRHYAGFGLSSYGEPITAIRVEATAPAKTDK